MRWTEEDQALLAYYMTHTERLSRSVIVHTDTVRNHPRTETVRNQTHQPNASRMRWTEEEDQALLAYVDRWPDSVHTELLWLSVAQHVFPATDQNPGRTLHACKSRYRKLRPPGPIPTDQSPPEPVASPISVVGNLNRLWWTEREDIMLYDLAKKTPRNWANITTKLNEQMGREEEAARTKKAVKSRYHMRGLRKSKKWRYWPEQEETYLDYLEMIHRKKFHGKEKWDIIADKLHEKFKYDEDGNLKEKRSASAVNSHFYGN